MNDGEKLFLEEIKDQIKELKENINKHFIKTCNELKEVSKNQIKIESDLNNHLKTVNERRISKREQKFLIIAGISTIITAVAIFT